MTAKRLADFLNQLEDEGYAVDPTGEEGWLKVQYEDHEPVSYVLPTFDHERDVYEWIVTTP